VKVATPAAGRARRRDAFGQCVACGWLGTQDGRTFRVIAGRLVHVRPGGLLSPPRLCGPVRVLGHGHRSHVMTPSAGASARQSMTAADRKRAARRRLAGRAVTVGVDSPNLLATDRPEWRNGTWRSA